MKTSEIKKLCEKHGFKLVREKKHFVWKHPSGAVLTTPKSTSNRHAPNNLNKRIKRLLAL